MVAAAALLFAHDPRRFVAGAEVQLVRRVGIGPGPGPTSDRESCCGPFEKTVGCCTGFIERHTRQFEVVTGVRRELVPEYPAAAVREAVVNALAHRDYALAGATIDITVWDDPSSSAARACCPATSPRPTCAPSTSAATG